MMKTAMNQNLPFTEQVGIASGILYYLSLLLEEMLKNVCKETDVISLNHEYYIVIRSIPDIPKVVCHT